MNEIDKKFVQEVPIIHNQINKELSGRTLTAMDVGYYHLPWFCLLSAVGMYYVTSLHTGLPGIMEKNAAGRVIYEQLLL
jgi:hypothetical protein